MAGGAVREMAMNRRAVRKGGGTTEEDRNGDGEQGTPRKGRGEIWKGMYHAIDILEGRERNRMQLLETYDERYTKRTKLDERRLDLEEREREDDRSLALRRICLEERRAEVEEKRRVEMAEERRTQLQVQVRMMKVLSKNMEK